MIEMWSNGASHSFRGLFQLNFNGMTLLIYCCLPIVCFGQIASNFGIVDFVNNSKWWFDTLKNEKEKLNDSTGEIRRNRTRIFVYPFGGPGYFENLPNKATIKTITHIETAIDPENYVIVPGPDDINQTKNGLYQRSVTLTARMWPPIEVGSPKLFGLPIVIWWGILTGCLIVLLISLLLLFLFCWFLPNRRQKSIKSIQESTVLHNLTGVTASNLDLTATRSTRSATKPWSNLINSNTSFSPPLRSPPLQSITSSSMYRQQYTLNYQQFPSSSSCGFSNATSFDESSMHNVPETHKSMWVINPLYASSGAFSETEANYRTRSLPAWGKFKQRPITINDDLAALYAKVHLSKKRRNRMRNDEAAIIALCRSRSQNLSAIPLEREGVVVYDERTEL